jgi:hypothetical protein
MSSHLTQNLRRNIETVIERLMDSSGRGLKREFIFWLCGSVSDEMQ